MLMRQKHLTLTLFTIIRMDQNNDKLVKESIFLCGVRDKDKDSASSGVSSGEDDISPCSSPPRPAITSS